MARASLFSALVLVVVAAVTTSCAGDPLSNARDTDEGAESEGEGEAAEGEGEAAEGEGENVDDELLGAPYPIILVHGFSGWMDVGGVEYFYNVPDDLRAAGADVTAPNLPPYDSSGERAQILARVVDNVLARTHKRKVHLIAHSQGGLDSRVLITDLGYADRVASLHTISTPHRGTTPADVAAAGGGLLNPIGSVLGFLLGTLEGSPNPAADWYDDDTAIAYEPDLEAALENMRPSSMERFNEAHPDPDGVPIFSVAGVSNLLSIDQPECEGGLWDFEDRVDPVDPIFAATGAYLSNTDGGWVLDPSPNDGLVSVASARWGTFLGCFAGDHLDEIGQLVDLTPGLFSGFDHRRFYLRLLAHVRELEAENPDD
jgi:triacylglycerol lipase